MLKTGAKLIIYLIAVITLSRCIDPYTPRLDGYKSFLVIDGLVTDQNSSYTVRLSKTLKEQFGIPEMVSDASIYITEDGARTINLKNMGSGIYKTDSTEFQGVIGKSYVLHVTTADGSEYESDPGIMESVPEIDSIYFEKEQQLTENGTVNNPGIKIYLDSKTGNDNKYFRWDYLETWKFGVPYPRKFNYIDSSLILPIADVKEFCWKSSKSNEVLINSVVSGQNGFISKEPISFIDPSKSDRLSLQYSILIRQYSISKKEYDFWNNIKMLDQDGGDIFASQPFPVISNLHSLNTPGEQVLGYFQVSAVKEKRKYITQKEILKLDIPFYRYSCERFVKDPLDYPNSFGSPPPTWDDLYNIFCKTSDYYFVEPVYIPGTTELEKMVFAKPECADCEFTGTSKKPDFWIDLN